MKSWIPPEKYRALGGRNVVLWEGRSQLTGDPIMAIATAINGNRKIGRMVQIWIIRSDISPIEAVKTGGDAAVCGDCKMRGHLGKDRACYVEYWRSVENIWQARDKARRMSAIEFARRYPGLRLRIGAYGDPVAVPVDVWVTLRSTADGWTAYTHQWRRVGYAYQSFCMASVDTVDEARRAIDLGWRTYRARLPEEGYEAYEETACPASEESGHRTVCARCELCQGLSKSAKHITIVAHGSGAKHLQQARRFALQVVS